MKCYQQLQTLARHLKKTVVAFKQKKDRSMMKAFHYGKCYQEVYQSEASRYGFVHRSLNSSYFLPFNLKNYFRLSYVAATILLIVNYVSIAEVQPTLTRRTIGYQFYYASLLLEDLTCVQEISSFFTDKLMARLRTVKFLV